MPKKYEKLELGEKEKYLGNLSVGDRYQVLIRHISMIENLLNFQANQMSIQAICLEELCKEKNIDIDKIINNKE